MKTSKPDQTHYKLENTILFPNKRSNYEGSVVIRVYFRVLFPDLIVFLLAPAPCPVPDDGVVLTLPVPVTVVAAAAKILFKYIFTMICF
jgi:hypothetical protein